MEKKKAGWIGLLGFIAQNNLVLMKLALGRLIGQGKGNKRKT